MPRTSSIWVMLRSRHDPTTGQPVVWYEGTGTASTDRRYFSADERGSIVSVSDSSGASLGINTYDEYGNPGGTLTGRYGYTGQAWLANAKLWYMNARMYSPNIGGRFMQPDPIGYAGDGPNLYAYVLNDPVNFVDPLGLCDENGNPGPGETVEQCPGIVVTGHSKENSFCDAFDVTCGPLTYAPPGPTEGGPGGPDIVVTGTKRNLTKCLVAVAKAAGESFIDPISVAGGLIGGAQAVYEAQNRISPQDYGKPEYRGVFKRSLSSALRIGAKRFIPGYLQISIAFAVVIGVKEAVTNPNCRI